MKHLLTVAFLLVAMFLFIYFKIDITLVPSFALSAVVLFSILIYHLYIERTFSPFVSAFIVFNFLFFIVAPIVQIDYMEARPSPEFVTRFPYKKDIVRFTNLLIIIFNSSFFIIYVFLKRYGLFKKIPKNTTASRKTLPVVIFTLFLLSGIIVLASYDFVEYEMERPSWVKSIFPKPYVLIWKKVLFLVPFAGFILCVQYFRSKYRKPTNTVFVFLALLVFVLLILWLKNPLNEKRNALGPIYICLLVLFLPRLLNSNIRMLWFLFLTMIVAFPLSAIFTHTDASLGEILKDPGVLFEENKGGGIATAFNTLNYDAFANIMATIEYVGEYGYAWGHQLLSAFLFFIPRSFWDSKPISTGELVGDHLIESYEFTYSNLSNPMVSEGYINFGVVGVVLGALLLVLVVLKFMTWLKSNNYLKKILAYYLAIHFIFLLRGDFANGFSYFIGTLIGVLVIPNIIKLGIMFLIQYQKRWKLSKKQPI